MDRITSPCRSAAYAWWAGLKLWILKRLPLLKGEHSQVDAVLGVSTKCSVGFSTHSFKDEWEESTRKAVSFLIGSLVPRAQTKDAFSPSPRRTLVTVFCFVVAVVHYTNITVQSVSKVFICSKEIFLILSLPQGIPPSFDLQCFIAW